MTESRINLNTAGVDTLAQLPGIAEALAARIVQYRENVHPFEEVIELAAVPGISERMVRQFEHLVTVEPALEMMMEVGLAEADVVTLAEETAEDGEAAAAVQPEAEEAGPAAETEADELIPELVEEEPAEAVEAEAEEFTAVEPADIPAEARMFPELDPYAEELPPDYRSQERGAAADRPAEAEIEMEGEAEEEADTSAEAEEQADTSAEPGAEAAEEIEPGEEADEAIEPAAEIPAGPAWAPSPLIESAPAAAPAREAAAPAGMDWRTVLIGALLGAGLAILAMILFNGGLRFQPRAAGDELQRTVDAQAATIEALTAELGQVNSSLDTVSTDTRSQFANLSSNVSTLNDTVDSVNESLEAAGSRLTAMEAVDADLQAADAELLETDKALGERIDTVAGSAEEFENFLTNLRDLLIGLKGLPEPAADAGTEATATPRATATSAPTEAPAPTATPAGGARATRTPRPTPTPLVVPTPKP